MRKLQEDIKLILDYCNVERAMNFEERKAYNRLLDFTQLHSIYQGIPVEDRLNEQEERIIDLKNTIIKITKAYQRKHDNTIVNLVDEIWEEDIEDLIIELNQDGGIRND